MKQFDEANKIEQIENNDAATQQPEPQSNQRDDVAIVCLTTIRTD